MPYGLMYQGQSDEEQDPAVAQVLELLRSLEPSAPPIAPRQPQQPSMGQSVFGGIGDALTSMASVRAGGGPIGTGPFASQQQARQRSYEEQLLDYNKRMEENAAADRTLRNTVRIGASQEAMRAKREAENIRIGQFAPEDPIRRAQIEETKRHNLATEGKPPNEWNPEVERHNKEMERLRGLEINKPANMRPLPASFLTKLSGQTEAVKAAQSAKATWERLKRPDLGTIFTMTPDRQKSKEGIEARRAISEALVPLRKYFLGSAVSESEKASAEPLLANLEGGVAPKVLEQSLIGLINIANRARRSALETAELGGYDVSRFPLDLPDEPTEAPTVAGESGRTLRVVIDENGDLKVEE